MANSKLMKDFIRTLLLFTLFAQTGNVKAQEIVYTREDSIFIENIIDRFPHSMFSSIGERAVAVAKEFIGRKYSGGTLDLIPGEPLFISTSELDCTTFVELAAAITMCREHGNRFESVCRNIEMLRYRNGIRDGYCSRLHYISWWIEDKAKQDAIEEVYTKAHTARQLLELNFMSRHSDKYKWLKNNPELRDCIAEREEEFGSRAIRYIPKQCITALCQEDIKDGDIISIVTSVEGLDVTHLGFACWHGNELHMIHASSSAGRVIYDTTSLKDYMEKQKSHLGIRVFRISPYNEQQ